ncbi:hypothetical protein, partial [Stenotrophomonas maltophilia]|uniref:hypothetical protein n=1 Tax=Stenotrophomonas maltophilia TaxID=40324 RepID=UPI001ADB0723
TSQHFAYLHTTAWEGTPTILFDVAAARLPICAPAVGGIVDFLLFDVAAARLPICAPAVGGIVDFLPESDLVPNPEDIAGFVREL